MGFYIRWNICSYGISVAPQHCCLVAFCQPQRHDSVPVVLGGAHPKSGDLRGPQKDSLFLPCVDPQEPSPDILGFGALSQTLRHKSPHISGAPIRKAHGSHLRKSFPFPACILLTGSRGKSRGGALPSPCRTKTHQPRGRLPPAQMQKHCCSHCTWFCSDLLQKAVETGFSFIVII